MADEQKPVDVKVPLPTGNSTDGTAGDSPMAATPGAVDATIDKVLDQAFAKTHEVWLSTIQYADQGHQILNETGRWTFQGAASNQVQLAAGILAQRSAQGQPQQTIYKP